MIRLAEARDAEAVHAIYAPIDVLCWRIGLGPEDGAPDPIRPTRTFPTT